MITSSKFIQISPICLLEYIYNSTVISTENATFARIYNAFNGTISYVNHNKNDINVAKELTGNTLETTVIQRRDNEYAHLDIDRPIKWFEKQNENIYIEGLWDESSRTGEKIYDLAIKPEQYILYDEIKLHIVEGFNFEDLAGMVLKVGYTDSSDFSTIYVANYAYLKENDNIEFHTRPFIIGDRAYNRYINFKVPSLRGLTEANNVLKNSLLPTKPPFPIKMPNINNSQINIIYYEVNKIVNEGGQTILYTNLPVGSDTNGIVRLNIEMNDALKYFTANIQESGSGDYFELFPSHQGQFIEDFLYERSKFGEEYRIVHDIDVYEHISSYGNYVEQKNQSITFFQIEGFNKPFKFRPIIENPNAVAFSIDYTVRLVNIYDPGNPIQTIRKASLTYPNAKKYGRHFTKINIEQGFKPMKIVNKIVKIDEKIQNASSVFELNNTKVIKEYNENYIFTDLNRVSVNINTLYVDSQQNIIYNSTGTIDSANLDNLISSDLVYGQGEGVLLLHEFDNFIKFKIYKIDENNKINIYTTLNSNKSYYNIVFEDDLGVKIRFADIGPDNGYNITKNEGELIFRLDTDNVRKILNNKNNKFFITVSNSVSSNTNEILQGNKYEIVLYTGKYYSVDSVVKSDYNFALKQSILNDKKSEIEAEKIQLNLVKQNINDLLVEMNGIQMSDIQKTQMNLYLKEFENIIKKYSEVD